MVSSKATTVTAYLSSLPSDRRAAIDAVRRTVNAKLPRGYEETMQYGMISWIIPLSRYPDTYNGQALAIASLGAQKNYNALYLVCAYQDPALLRELREGYRAAGKRLDMGKACIRFKTEADVALDTIGSVVSKSSLDGFLAHYEKARAGTKAGKKAAAKKKAPAKKKAAKKKARRASSGR